MTDYDMLQICRLLMREDNIITNELIGLENTYQIFHRFDELDMLALMSAKIRKNIVDDFGQQLLSLCDYLLKYNKEG